MPPLPPPPPDIRDDSTFKRLLQRVAANPDVVAKLGSDAVMASKDVHGHIQINGGARADGAVDIRLAMRGPKGQADVHVDAQLDDGEWSLDQVDVVGPVR